MYDRGRQAQSMLGAAPSPRELVPGRARPQEPARPMLIAGGTSSFYQLDSAGGGVAACEDRRGAVVLRASCLSAQPTISPLHSSCAGPRCPRTIHHEEWICRSSPHARLSDGHGHGSGRVNGLSSHRLWIRWLTPPWSRRVANWWPRDLSAVLTADPPSGGGLMERGPYSSLGWRYCWNMAALVWTRCQARRARSSESLRRKTLRGVLLSDSD